MGLPAYAVVNGIMSLVLLGLLPVPAAAYVGHGLCSQKSSRCASGTSGSMHAASSTSSSRAAAAAPSVAQETRRVVVRRRALGDGVYSRVESGGEDGWAAPSVAAATEAGRAGNTRAEGGSAMQNLRHSVAELPRLSREDELALCKDVQRWQRLEKLRKDLSASSGGGRGKVGLEAWASAAGISVADLRKVVQRGAGARERLVLSHIRLVMFLAGKRTRNRKTALSSTDLIQEGAIALHLAVERYDPGRGVRFFTYADWSLRAAFEKAEASQSTTIAMPRYVYVQKRRLKAILSHHGPQAQKALAASLDISERQVTKLLRWANDCQSSDRVLTIGGVTLGDTIPSSQTSEAILRRLDAEASIIRLLGYLKPQEEQVIVHRYGLFGRGRKSTPAVAAVMGVSRQYVGRVHRTALRKMRASFEEHQNEEPGLEPTAAGGGGAVRLKRLTSKRRSAIVEQTTLRKWTL